MTWPSVTIDTTSMDASTDSPATARAQIKQMADNVNAIKDSRGAVSGVASLDAGGKVPTSQIPAIPANQGGTGQTSYAIGDLLYASASGVLSKLSAGTAGYGLKSGGSGAAPTWQPDSNFPSGTRMIFQQTTAPTGWTKETGAAYNDIALRVVTGAASAGGATAFSSTFSGSKSTDAFTLGTAHIPAHAHGIQVTISGSSGSYPASSNNVSVQGTASTQNAGSGGAHSHTIGNFNLKYSDVIIASKN